VTEIRIGESSWGNEAVTAVKTFWIGGEIFFDLIGEISLAKGSESVNIQLL